ncbi:polymer-forming cytoskeletal protein [Halorubrum yunnanense]|uniref:Polymer-forming cytoskeletal protein n=1 Tax=Halorubrum yunnanense TaxID=1526162 RepID=A0ABD5YJK9_9EURY|nr:polymer-forming cytoskeletal protein [Halorubrum yunnanense]
MSLRGDGPIEELAVPSGTTVEEHDLVVDGDVLVGGQSTVEFGLRGRNVAIGERVRVGNDIEAEGDCRLDTWCTVDGNVLVGEDAYLGERVTVTGRLMVSGDLDIGDDVSIEEGFEANGWIVIRNPVPTIVFYFIVLSQLLRVGETDAADELAEALADGEDVRDPLLVPRGAEISDDAWRVSTPATVGDDCRLHGNLRAESVRVGERNEVFGSLRAREGITVGAGTVIHGDVTTRGGTVTIEAGARVLGDVSAGDLVVHDGAEIDGSLRARGEMKLVQEAGEGDGDEGDDTRDTDETDESDDTLDTNETDESDDENTEDDGTPEPPHDEPETDEGSADADAEPTASGGSSDKDEDDAGPGRAEGDAAPEGGEDSAEGETTETRADPDAEAT